MACTECARKSRPILKRSNVSYIARVLALALCLCLSASVCLSVCLSVTSRCSIEMDGRIELVFGMQASFDQFYTVLSGNSGSYKNKGTSFWNFVQNSGLAQFCSGISIVETCYRLSSRKVDAHTHSVINWAVVGRLR